MSLSGNWCFHSQPFLLFKHKLVHAHACYWTKDFLHKKKAMEFCNNLLQGYSRKQQALKTLPGQVTDFCISKPNLRNQKELYSILWFGKHTLWGAGKSEFFHLWSSMSPHSSIYFCLSCIWRNTTVLHCMSTKALCTQRS